MVGGFVLLAVAGSLLPEPSATGRHNMRELDTLDQMREVVLGMNGKRWRYRDLVA